MTDQEVNIAVARKLGWEPRNYDPQSIEPIKRIPCFTAPNGDLYANVPDYCHSIAAALEIIEKGFLDGVQIRISDGKWIAGKRGEEIEKSIPADTAPRAICEAFLKLP